MDSMSLGDRVNKIVNSARGVLFRNGQLVQLTWAAYRYAINEVGKRPDGEEIELKFPVGLGADRKPYLGSKKYTKESLVDEYKYLTEHQVAVNSVVHLVTVLEAMFGDLIRAVIAKYPHKIGKKKTVPTQLVLSSNSLDEIHMHAINSILNVLAYESPEEYTKSFEAICSIKLLECPAYHRYIEVKATRDIIVHNQGTANETYVRKAKSHSRATEGQALLVNAIYFMESYEQCLQLCDWLEIQLHETWHCADFQSRLDSHSGGLFPEDSTDE